MLKLKQISNSDAAIFRRGFYSCPEEHSEEVSEYSEMTRKISHESEAVFKKENFRKRRIQKKVKVIRRSMRQASLSLNHSRKTSPDSRN